MCCDLRRGFTLRDSVDDLDVAVTKVLNQRSRRTRGGGLSTHAVMNDQDATVEKDSRFARHRYAFTT